MPPFIAKALNSSPSLRSFEREIEIIKTQNVHCYLYGEENYPLRLSQCYDAPIVLFSKGEALIDSRPVLAIVGTRRSTKYGRDFCRSLIEQSVNLDVVIASRLALGIDTCAHRVSLDNKLENWAVLAHGLGQTYPPDNARIALDIAESDLLISEHLYEEKAEKENFPLRNRIIAGLASAVVVVESPQKGGVLIMHCHKLKR